ncbi:MAG: sulfatase, partial [Planctomycetota bacterium]
MKLALKLNLLIALALVSVHARGAESKAEGGKPHERPNILFCIADDWSYPHATAYGCEWVKTPAFDRVAREGILFTRCYTPNAKCAPSRSCVLTGRNSWQLGAAANHVPFFPPEFKVYPEVLSENGYFVGMTGKGWAPGTSLTADGKDRPLAGRVFSQLKTRPPAKGIAPTDYAANFEAFLKAAPKGEPWCFWYGGHEPHRVYEYQSGVKKGGKQLSDIDRVPDYWPKDDIVRHDMLDYAYEVEHFDQHLGRMLESLEKNGLLENTLIVVTADNGMPFPRAKGMQYEISSHMPLAVMWKEGINKPGRVVDDYVSFIDFAPTFLELAGLRWEETGMAPTPGQSLTKVFESGDAGHVDAARDHVLLGQERHDVGRPHDWGYPIRGIMKDGMLYLRNYEPARWPQCNPETGYMNTDGSPTKTLVLELRRKPEGEDLYWKLCFGKRPAEELYNVARDPECITNLADESQYAETKKALETQLVSELKAQEDPRMFGRGEIFEKFPCSEDKMRGYYERFMGGEKFYAGWVEKTDYEKE